MSATWTTRRRSPVGPQTALHSWGLTLVVAAFAGAALAPQVASGATACRVTTFAGVPATRGSHDGPVFDCGFAYPNALAQDTQGVLYVADSLNHLVRKIVDERDTFTLAGHRYEEPGNGHHQPEPGDGPAEGAHFYYPVGLAVRPSGAVVVADSWHHTLREITPTGLVRTLAGQARTSGYVDGPADQARFNRPTGLALDRLGNLFVADADNHVIRKLDPAGRVSTVAGAAGHPGFLDGIQGEARFNHPVALAVDRAGNLYIADELNSAIRKLSADGTVTTLAGHPGDPGHADGPDQVARFGRPSGVAVNRAGEVFVVDSWTSVLRRISPAGEVETLAGCPEACGLVDGTGAEARFNAPTGLAVCADGSLLVADANNFVLRRITLSPPTRLEMTFEAGRPQVRITGEPGTTGVVEFRESLADAVGWREMRRFELADACLLLDLPKAPAGNQMFFRLRP